MWWKSPIGRGESVRAPTGRFIMGASIYLREKIELQQEKEYERKYITASMTGEQDAERLI